MYRREQRKSSSPQMTAQMPRPTGGSYGGGAYAEWMRLASQAGNQAMLSLLHNANGEADQADQDRLPRERQAAGGFSAPQNDMAPASGYGQTGITYDRDLQLFSKYTDLRAALLKEYGSRNKTDGGNAPEKAAAEEKGKMSNADKMKKNILKMRDTETKAMMQRNDLFTRDNYAFASVSNGKVGSMYFGGGIPPENEKSFVEYGGRIRLVHRHASKAEPQEEIMRTYGEKSGKLYEEHRDKYLGGMTHHSRGKPERREEIFGQDFPFQDLLKGVEYAEILALPTEIFKTVGNLHNSQKELETEKNALEAEAEKVNAQEKKVESMERRIHRYKRYYSWLVSRLMFYDEELQLYSGKGKMFQEAPVITREFAEESARRANNFLVNYMGRDQRMKHIPLNLEKYEEIPGYAPGKEETEKKSFNEKAPKMPASLEEYFSKSPKKEAKPKEKEPKK